MDALMAVLLGELLRAELSSSCSGRSSISKARRRAASSICRKKNMELTAMHAGTSYLHTGSFFLSP